MTVTVIASASVPAAVSAGVSASASASVVRESPAVSWERVTHNGVHVRLKGNTR